MEIVLEVPDKDVARVLELVRGIKQVKVLSPKKAPATATADLATDLREAGQELARLRKGEAIGRPAHELLSEL